MGKIVTFYSYNGGSGKSMALANVATLLTRWGYRTLMIDWDLEAPGGISHFFEGSITSEKVPAAEGMLDLLYSANELTANKRSQPINHQENGGVDTSNGVRQWQELVLRLDLKLGDAPEGELELLTAGRGTPEYFNKLHTFDVRDFYAGGGATYVERLRSEWKAKYDFVLIDCRSGITPLGSVCTIQLPDILVLLLQCDDRDLDGGVSVAKHVTAARELLPFDRVELLTIPVPARFDPDASPTGYDYEHRWLTRFDLAVADFYKPWLPKKIQNQEMLKDTAIPYDAKSLVDDDRLPSLYKRLPESAEISKAYENIASLLANNLDRANLLHEDRSDFLGQAWKNFSVDRALKLHDEWLRTKHRYGQRANLTDRDCSNLNLPRAQLREGIFVNTNFKSTNLLGANVIKANFSGANLQGAILKEIKGAKANFTNADLYDAKLGKADLRRAQLESAKLTKADLSEADLYKANLRKAVLDGATGLTSKQFKAVDLSFAKLPAGVGEFRRLKDVQSQSRRARIIFFVLGLLCVFSVSVLFQIDHVGLVNNDRLGPLVGGIPTIWFVNGAPVILFSLYFLILLFIQQLWTNVVELPAYFPDGFALNEKLSDWFTAAVAYPRFDAKVISGRVRLALSLLTRFLVPFTLLFFWVKILPLRNIGFIVFHTLLVAFTFALGWSYRRLALKTLQQNNTSKNWTSKDEDESDVFERAA